MANGWNSESDRDAMLRRVAIVLSSLPAPTANRLLGTMGEASRVAVRRTMTRLADVDPLERQRAIQAFRVSIQEQPVGDPNPADSDEAISRVMSADSIDVHSATTDVTQVDRGGDDSQLSFLGNVNDDVLLSLLGIEHPQTIALVLASIPPTHAARILPRLEAGLRTDTLTRLGRLGEIPEAAAAEVAAHFHNRLSSQKGGAKATGQRVLDAILAAMPKNAAVDDTASGAQGASSYRGIAPAVDPLPGDRVKVGSQNADVPPKDGTQTDLPWQNAEAIGVNLPSFAGTSDDLSLRLRQAVGLDAGESGDRPKSRSRPAEMPNPGNSQRAATADYHVANPDSAMNDHVMRMDHALADTVPSVPAADQDVSPLRSTDSIHQHLVALEPLELCQALGKVDTRDAMLSLCGLPNHVAEAALAMLPRSHAKKVRASMRALGSVQLREIDESKERVAQASLAASEMTTEPVPIAA